MEITTIFLALLALMYLILALRVSIIRPKVGATIGNGKNETLTLAIRVHGNFAEYVPLLIFIMWLLEYNTASTWFLWVFGIALVTGRISHAYGMWNAQTPDIARGVGMLITYGLLLIGPLYLLYFAFT